MDCPNGKKKGKSDDVHDKACFSVVIVHDILDVYCYCKSKKYTDGEYRKRFYRKDRTKYRSER